MSLPSLYVTFEVFLMPFHFHFWKKKKNGISRCNLPPFNEGRGQTHLGEFERSWKFTVEFEELDTFFEQLTSKARNNPCPTFNPCPFSSKLSSTICASDLSVDQSYCLQSRCGSVVPFRISLCINCTICNLIEEQLYHLQSHCSIDPFITIFSWINHMCTNRLSMV